MGASGEWQASGNPRAPCEVGCKRASSRAAAPGHPHGKSCASIGQARWPQAASVRFFFATSCEQLEAADGSFNRATRLGPSSGALWMGHEKASVQVTGSGYPHGGLATGAGRASSRPHAPCARGRRAGRAKPSPKGAVRLGVPCRGKLHGGATAASVRSRCDVLRAAGARRWELEPCCGAQTAASLRVGQGARVRAQT